MKGIESYFYIKSQNKFLHCTEPSKCRLYYMDFYLDLITGEKVYTPIEELLESLKSISMNHISATPYVFHLFYELGHLWVTNRDLLPSNKPLAIEIEYSNYRFIPQSVFQEDKVATELNTTEYPIFKNYATKFEKIYDHLLEGNCYQVNLTSKFHFNIESQTSPLNILKSLWRDKNKISAYAHATYLHPMGKMFLSNSPESLFSVNTNQTENAQVFSAPIKGTMDINEFGGDYDRAYKALKKSKKDQAELYMIADLVRNDLAKIAETPAIIKSKKAPLFVPGIAHQFSLISCFVSKETTLLDILSALFPGGSITGAPKKRVMQIINELEKEKRGFYCGSTVIWHGSMKRASINIRSCEIDFLIKELSYGAGGGITLNSHVQDEFDEVYVKMKSFIKILRS
jgi:para-aminobenzoate synthetase component 1